mmetsp:Transcript_22256/g.37883  ORF Transcript_22256/g.37883 Transcript_22256/m.37883 type:complete len:300 (-) Transcript_22256:310-1209(-)
MCSLKFVVSLPLHIQMSIIHWQDIQLLLSIANVVFVLIPRAISAATPAATPAATVPIASHTIDHTTTIAFFNLIFLTRYQKSSFLHKATAIGIVVVISSAIIAIVVSIVVLCQLRIFTRRLRCGEHCRIFYIRSNVSTMLIVLVDVFNMPCRRMTPFVPQVDWLHHNRMKHTQQTKTKTHQPNTRQLMDIQRSRRSGEQTTLRSGLGSIQNIVQNTFVLLLQQPSNYLNTLAAKHRKTVRIWNNRGSNSYQVAQLQTGMMELQLVGKRKSSMTILLLSVRDVVGVLLVGLGAVDGVKDP